MSGHWSGAGFPLGLILALALLTAWLQYTVELPNEGSDGKGRHDPDYFIEGATITKLDTAGALQYTMHAARILHFPDNDSTEMRQPTIRYLRPDAPPLLLAADAAQADAGGKEVRLSGNVVVERAAGKRQPALIAKMDWLTVFPDDERAMTDAPVSILQGSSRLQGTGMLLDNPARTLVLQSKVTGHFARAHQNR